MEKKDLKSDMIELLREDDDLRNIIRDICNTNPIETVKNAIFSQTSEKNYNVEEIKELKVKLAASERKISDLQSDLERQNISLIDAERTINNLERENLRLKREAADKDNAYRELAAQLQKSEKENRNLQNNIVSLRNESKQMQQKITTQEQQLSERFPEGWELFCAYQNVSQQSRDRLKGVFVKADDFCSFICGGAQDKSLGKIWDEIKSCLSAGNTQDADILWDIFEYAVELVNSAKTERIYEIMQVNIGEPFDLDLHTLAAGSRAQGNIREVYLLGYKNVYVGSVEKKSIVSV